MGQIAFILFRMFWTAVVVVTMIVILGLWVTSDARAHSWYDIDCCSKFDCTPATKIEHQEGFQVWHTKRFGMIKVDQSFWKLNAGRIRPSKDDQHHICVRLGPYSKRHLKSIRCLYVPGGV